MKIEDLTNGRLKTHLHSYGVDPNAELCDKIRIYISTLLQWNKKISLTAITDPEEILLVHFGESFYAVGAADIAAGRLADIGTGAGFPGIPIRMVNEEVKVTLIEPSAKKVAFLGEVIRRTELNGVQIIRCRMEDLSPETAPFDFLTARALGRYASFLEWSKSRVSNRGSVVLMIGENEAERLRNDPSWCWQNARRIPGTTGRFVLQGFLKPYGRQCST